MLLAHNALHSISDSVFGIEDNTFSSRSPTMLDPQVSIRQSLLSDTQCEQGVTVSQEVNRRQKCEAGAAAWSW